MRAPALRRGPKRLRPRAAYGALRVPHLECTEVSVSGKDLGDDDAMEGPARALG